MSLITKFLNYEQIEFCKTNKIDNLIEEILIQINDEDISVELGQTQIFDLLNKTDKDKKELNFVDFKEFIDEGDYIQAGGNLEYSKSGEASLFVDNYTILTKSLRPLPEKMEYDNTESR